ncbi:ATP-binding protein [Jannaschia marina]|uniref:ATP-binding protein n=1 Tax=Jannaschia marina TaxID=2741674 RepID=UPI0015CEDC78|nr:ATP-binding protein [Jannaschia marina]
MSGDRLSSLPGQPEGEIRHRFPATPEAISRQLADLSRFFAACGIAPDLREKVTVVLGEVLNNIAEHAVPDGRGDVDLVICPRPDGLHVETVDSGRALPPWLLTSADLPEMGTTIDDLPEGGFGWFIIHALVDDMIYERERGRNRLSFSVCAA